MVHSGHFHVACALVSANSSGEGVNIGGNRIGQSLCRSDGSAKCVVGFAVSHGITRTTKGDGLLCVCQSSIEGFLHFGNRLGLNTVFDVCHGGIDTSDECVVVAHTQLGCLCLCHCIVEGKHLSLASRNRGSHFASRTNLELAIGEVLVVACVNVVSIGHLELECSINRLARVEGEAARTSTDAFYVKASLGISLSRKGNEGLLGPSHIAFSIHRTTKHVHGCRDVAVTTIVVGASIVACTISYHEFGEFVARQLHLKVVGHLIGPASAPLRVEEGSGVAIEQCLIRTFAGLLGVGVELVSAGDVVRIFGVASDVFLHGLSSGNGRFQFSCLSQDVQHRVKSTGILYREHRGRSRLRPTRQFVLLIEVQPRITRTIVARGAVERSVITIGSLGVNGSVCLSNGFRRLAVTTNAEIQTRTYVLNLVLAFGFSLNELPSEEALVSSGQVGQGNQSTLCTNLITIEADVARVAVVASMIEHEARHGFGIGTGFGFGEFSLGVGSHGSEGELTSLGRAVRTERNFRTYAKSQVLNVLTIGIPGNRTVFEVFSDDTLRRSDGRPALLALSRDVEDELADVLGIVRNHHNVVCVGTEVLGIGIDGGFGRPRLFRCLNAPISLS